MFLSPLILVGALAVSLPIAIHLLRRTPPRSLKWAATRFLKKAHAANKNRLRVQDLLLLLLRCLIVLLLALALARPMLGGWLGSLFASTGMGSTRAIVLLDRSLSMQQVDGASPLFEQAKQSAKSVVGSLPTGSTAALWLVDSRVEQVIPEPIGQLSIVAAAIDNARPTDRGTNLSSAIEMAIDRAVEWAGAKNSSLSGGGRPVHIFVVTDFQQNALDGAAAIARKIESARATAKFMFVPVGSIDRAVRPNLSVDRVELMDGIATTARPLRLRVTITNHDLVQASSVRVRVSSRPAASTISSGLAPDLTLDQRVVNTIGPGQSASISLLARVSDPGEHVVTASIAPDALSADDQASLLVNVKPAFRIGIASNSPGLGGTRLDGSTFFVEQALSAMNAGGGAVRLVQLASSDLPIVNLSGFDALFVFDRDEIGSNLAQQLLSFVDGGGTLVFVPPSSASVGLAPAVDAGLLPAELGPLQRGLSVGVDGAFLDHPLMTLWKQMESGGVGDVRFSSVFDLTPRPGATNVFRSTAGKPLMVEQAIGRGYVVMLASGLDRLSSNMPLRPGVFVPLMARVIARGQSMSLGTLNTPLDEWASSRLGEVDQSTEVTLVDPQQQPIRASVAMIQGRFVAQTDQASHAGVHLWQRGERTLSLLNLQRDPSESNTTLLTREERALLANSGASQQSGSQVRQSQQGFELAEMLLMLLLGLAGLEMFLAKRFTPQSQEVKKPGSREDA